MLYVSRLIRQKEIARGTKLFEFERPKGFLFKAGQSIDVVLNVKHSEKLSQTFSLASAPEEKTLMIATRERASVFKKKLFSLKVGDEVKIEGAFGSFILHSDTSRPAVFIAGGIGVTPFISMLREKFSSSNQRVTLGKIYLFYSNHRPEDAAFLEELNGYGARHENFHFVPTMTAPVPMSHPDGGEVDRIDKKMLEKYLGKPTNHIFYIAGTLAFVVAMREVVLSLDVSEENIRTDEFPGY